MVILTLWSKIVDTSITFYVAKDVALNKSVELFCVKQVVIFKSLLM